MKLFLDSANVEQIGHWVKIGIIDGVTTNPTLLAVQDGAPREIIGSISVLLPNGDISVEVTEQKPDAVLKQAREIAKIGNNITVKIPCHLDYYSVIKRLVSEGVGVNVTLVFSPFQALCMCKLGVKYVSSFVGRWDDSAVSGTNVLHEIRGMIDQYGYKTQLLAASIRHVGHLNEAIAMGVDVITVPEKVLQKATRHILTDQGIQLFLDDWKRAGKLQFP